MLLKIRVVGGLRLIQETNLNMWWNKGFAWLLNIRFECIVKNDCQPCGFFSLLHIKVTDILIEKKASILF